MAARRRVAKSAAPPAEGVLPGVLTVAAVASGYMPPGGESGLPPSLEEGVPYEYRYWQVTDTEKAREVRDALVESGLVRPDSVMEVDGQPRRVVQRPHLAVVEPPEGEVVYAEKAGAAALAALCVEPTEDAVLVLEVGQAPAPSGVSGLATGKPWVVAYEDGPEVRKALLGVAASTFTLKTRPGLLFGSSLGVVSARLAEVVETPPVPAVGVTVKDVRGVRLLKAAEERYVLGVVLEPDVVDAQGDTYSAEEVRKAAHGFMERHGGRMVLQHARDGGGEPVPEPSIVVLETYLAPVDFTVGEEKVKAGTWLLGARYNDDALWEKVKAGALTGWSIGGTALAEVVSQ